MARMKFITVDGETHEVDAPLGLSVLEIAHRNKIDLEGACEGSLACSTCHVVVESEWYDLLTEATEDEEDMFRLICQRLPEAAMLTISHQPKAAAFHQKTIAL